MPTPRKGISLPRCDAHARPRRCARAPHARRTRIPSALPTTVSAPSPPRDGPAPSAAHGLGRIRYGCAASTRAACRHAAKGRTIAPSGKLAKPAWAKVWTSGKSGLRFSPVSAIARILPERHVWREHQGDQGGIDLAADQIVDHLRAALVRHMRHIDAGQALEHFHGNVIACATASRRVRKRRRTWRAWATRSASDSAGMVGCTTSTSGIRTGGRPARGHGTVHSRACGKDARWPADCRR